MDEKEKKEEVGLTAKDVQATVDAELGGVHLQVGKTYQFKEGLQPDTYKIIQGIKALVDPKGRVNPGTLGLE